MLKDPRLLVPATFTGWNKGPAREDGMLAPNTSSDASIVIAPKLVPNGTTRLKCLFEIALRIGDHVLACVARTKRSCCGIEDFVDIKMPPLRRDQLRNVS